MVQQSADIKFNAETVKETILKKIIPDGFEQRRMQHGRFVIETKWKHGFIKKILVDDTDITNKVVQAQSKVELILKMSKKFRTNYTGTISFICTIEGFKLDSLYVNLGSYILTKFSGQPYKTATQHNNQVQNH